MNDRDRTVGLAGQYLAEQSGGLRRITAVQKLVRISQPAVVFRRRARPKVMAILRRNAAAHDTDGNVAPPVKRVHQVDERRRVPIVLRNRHGQQLALALAFQRMNQGQRHGVVDVVANIGIKNEPRRLSGGRFPGILRVCQSR